MVIKQALETDLLPSEPELQKKQVLVNFMSIINHKPSSPIPQHYSTHSVSQTKQSSFSTEIKA